MTTNKAVDYWKIKAALHEARSTTNEARLAMIAAEQRFHAVLRAAGLDPAIAYDLDDAAETITPKQP